jgi:hypothetical protein
MASPSFAPHTAGNDVTLNLQATLDALSDYLKSPMMVDGLPGSPIRPLGEESTLDTPDNLTHLIFYPSDQVDHMSLMMQVVRNGKQIFVFEVTLPEDDNLLFRAAATAALTLNNWNPNTVLAHSVYQDMLVASDAETLALRRIIEYGSHSDSTMQPILPSTTRSPLSPFFDPDAERIAYEHGMRRLTPSPELQAS